MSLNKDLFTDTSQTLSLRAKIFQPDARESPHRVKPVMSDVWVRKSSCLLLFIFIRSQSVILRQGTAIPCSKLTPATRALLTIKSIIFLSSFLGYFLCGAAQDFLKIFSVQPYLKTHTYNYWRLYPRAQQAGAYGGKFLRIPNLVHNLFLTEV